MAESNIARPLGGDIIRPGQGASCNHRMGLNAKTGTLVDVDGEEIHFPVKCASLEVQPRLCGDHYAEISGVGFCVAGFGSTRPEVVRHALSKIGGAA